MIVVVRDTRVVDTEGSPKIGEPLLAIQVVLTNASPGPPQDRSMLHPQTGCNQVSKRPSLSATPAWYRHQHRILLDSAAISQKLNQAFQPRRFGGLALPDDKCSDCSGIVGEGLPGQRLLPFQHG